MTIPFFGATGDFFERLGKLGLLIKTYAIYQQAQEPNMIDTTTGVVAQYNAESDIQAVMGNSYISNLAGPPIDGIAQAITQLTVNRMVYRDMPQIGQNLSNINLINSIQVVLEQMIQTGNTVLAMTIGATPQLPFANQTSPVAGNGVFVVSTTRPLDGRVEENSYGETVSLTCIQDSYSGGATPGNENFAITGQGNEPDIFAFDWPLGSNAAITFQAINGNSSNGGGNLLTNSGFTNWTNTNTPNNFVILAGAAGTNIFQESTLVFGTGPAMRILCNGTQVSFQQQFSSSVTGTGGQLIPQTQYAFNIYIRGAASPPGAGVLTISLVDQNGTVINNAGNPVTPNTFDFSLTGLNTIYTSFSCVFQTPVILPTQQFIRYTFSTPVSGGYSVYLDLSSMGLMSQHYVSGPSYAIFAGSTNFVLNDQAFCIITNSRGVAGTLNTWQTAWMRLLDPYVFQNEFMLPSSSVPTVSDNLIG